MSKIELLDFLLFYKKSKFARDLNLDFMKKIESKSFYLRLYN